MKIKISFHGAAQTVTGSQFLLQADGKKILIDCGLTQGKRKESYELNKNFRFPDKIKPSEIDAVVLTHAHIDHSGNLPTLAKQGFSGSIHATRESVELCSYMLHDSAHLQSSDLKIANKNRARQNKNLFSPLYTGEDVDNMLGQFVSHGYEDTFELSPNIKFRFRDAGHILGSAGILFEIGEGKNPVRFGFSGDIGRENIPLIHDPDILRDLDFLVMETTYGNRLHSQKFGDAENALADAITNAINQQAGTILIPAFSVGRIQLLVYVLHKLRDRGLIRDIPVFVDSPLGLHATEIFQKHLGDLDREAHRSYIDQKIDPFDFTGLHYIRSLDDSMKLKDKSVQPRIIISSSGMMEGGRILYHLMNHIEDTRATLLFVGYPAENTLARYISDGAKEVKIFGEPFNVRCKVQKLDSFSAHADKSGLEKYLSFSSPHNLKKLFLVHGESQSAQEFLCSAKQSGYQNVCVPSLDEEYSFDLETNKYFDSEIKEYVEKYEITNREIKKPEHISKDENSSFEHEESARHIKFGRK
ncbi:MAG: MBL fold metallo-hydrolase [Chitinispirillales bacterium]|jgi:metallo-beta-lactamase family protein|nr:MBL fold metallo-hydrolase [Chitinispirillales bacterium]